MSTRAVYSFKDKFGTHHVYKHCDGYPSGAVDAINAALAYSWLLPRFEADEFAAGFVAGNKHIQGGVRLTKGPQKHYDIEYQYIITASKGELMIAAYETDTDENDKQTKKQFYKGSFVEFERKYKESN